MAVTMNVMSSMKNSPSSRELGATSADKPCDWPRCPQKCRWYSSLYYVRGFPECWSRRNKTFTAKKGPKVGQREAAWATVGAKMNEIFGRNYTEKHLVDMKNSVFANTRQPRHYMHRFAKFYYDDEKKATADASEDDQRDGVERENEGESDSGLPIESKEKKQYETPEADFSGSHGYENTINAQSPSTTCEMPSTKLPFPVVAQ